MKKRFLLLLFSVLLILTVLPVSPAAAASPELTVSADVNNSAKSVTISGTISSGADQQVTLVVTNPSGSVDYINQTTSGNGGSYVFQYTLDENESGTYAVKVGGSGISSPVTATFTYTKRSGDSGGGNNGGGNNGGGDDDAGGDDEGNGGSTGGNGSNDNNQEPDGGVVVNPESYVVNEDSLRSSTGQDGNRVIVNIPNGAKEVLLPLNAAELLGNRSLVVQTEQMTMTLQPKVLTDLRNLAGNEELADHPIALMLEQGTREEINESLPSGQDGLIMRTAGHIVGMDLTITTAAGQISRLSDFSEQIEASLPYDENADVDLLGVYYHNEETGQWEYVGGSIDEDNHRIVADLTKSGTYAVLEYDKTFVDVPAEYWANSTIKVLAAKHIINGISDTEFAPKQSVTRAEFTALLVRALGLNEETQSQPFSDVSGTAWYAGDVALAFEAGIITGKSANTFQPTASIAREEMAAMLVRAFEYANGGQAAEPANGEAQAGYADQVEVSAWAVAYVNRAAEAGLMNGNNDDMFMPKEDTIRAETAQAIYNLVKRLED